MAHCPRLLQRNENSIVVAWGLAAMTHFTCRCAVRPQTCIPPSLSLRFAGPCSLCLRQLCSELGCALTLPAPLSRRSYLAIRSLNLDVVNCKRAVLLARHFVREGTVLKAAELSPEEPVLLPVELVAPRLHIGCRPQDALPALGVGEERGKQRLEPLRWGAEMAAAARAGGSNQNRSGDGSGGHEAHDQANGHGSGSGRGAAPPTYALLGGDISCETAAGLYQNERYVLTVRGGSVYIALREDAGSTDVLKAVWQAVALEQGQMTPEQSLAAANDAATGGMAFARRVVEAGWKPETLLKELDSKQRFRIDGQGVDAAHSGPTVAR